MSLSSLADTSNIVAVSKKLLAQTPAPSPRDFVNKAD
jgi:hypothetical protein